MKQTLLIFLLAIALPSGALTWLAVQSLQHQQLLSEREQTLLVQNATDAIARSADLILDQQISDFATKVDAILEEHSAQEAASIFDPLIRKDWTQPLVGFSVEIPSMKCASPTPDSSKQANEFLKENLNFLCSTTNTPVYSKSANLPVSKESAKRTVVPAWSPPGSLATLPKEGDFLSVVENRSQGILSRFLQDELSVMTFYRSDQAPDHVFGAQLELAKIKKLLQSESFHGTTREILDQWLASYPELLSHIQIHILDDHGQPIQEPATTNDWKSPFIASEISDSLPHWEIAAYLSDPDALKAGANKASWMLSVTICLLALTITTGSVLLIRQIHRQISLARQKTDFVSNVSHELKTPLTSIRMFSELLIEKKDHSEEKRKQFLTIIRNESSRLNRLINNVLDFARLDRKEHPFSMIRLPLDDLVQQTCEDFRPALEEDGFVLQIKLGSEKTFVHGDQDALTQVLLNLLSNAHNYSPNKGIITVSLKADKDAAIVEVHDEGEGMPDSENERIFEQFYRLHDRLDSEQPGTGLGLTLARQIVKAHSGRIYRRPGTAKGSCFVVELPLSK